MYRISSTYPSKLGFYLLIFFCGIAACTDNDDELQNACVQLVQNPNWKTENFKTNFTIQFPDNYEGLGLIMFEGNTFRKFRKDEKIEFTSGFCTPLFCNDFGFQPLEKPIPSSISVSDRAQNEQILSEKMKFCSNNEVIGYFYFNEEANSIGMYYMKRDSVYLEAVKIYFSNTEIQEVENIIKTIVEK